VARCVLTSARRESATERPRPDARAFSNYFLKHLRRVADVRADIVMYAIAAACHCCMKFVEG